MNKWGKPLQVGTIGGGEETKEEPKEAVEEDTDDGADDAFFGEGMPFGDPYWYQDFHSPFYNDSHRRLRKAMRKWVEKEIMPNVFKWDEEKILPDSLVKAAAEAGVLAACVTEYPHEYTKVPILFGAVDPKEFDPFHMAIVVDELARCASGGVMWGLIGGLGIGLPPVMHFGPEAMKKRVIADCVEGRKRICLAITEPSGGSDVANITTVAKKTEDGKHYIVNGEKKWITNGIWADYFTVAVRTGGKGMGGISLLLIEKDMPGVKTRRMDCTGVWSSGTTYITFEDVKVPVENIIGKENQGFKCIMSNFNGERMGIVIQANRLARVCYEEALKYSHKRHAFGEPLFGNPLIRNKLAHMARQIEATHAWMELGLYNAKMMEDRQTAMLRLGGTAALLKAQATQTLAFCSGEAVQIFGGLGYTRGGVGEKVERIAREVRAYSIPGGSEEVMLELGMRQSVKVAQVLGAKL